MPRSTLPAGLLLSTFTALSAGCSALGGAGDVAGSYAVEYEPTWNIYEGGELVAQIEAGDGSEVELSEGVFVFDVLCEDAEALCPDEALWGSVQVVQLWKDEGAAIQIVNRDLEVGQLGDRLLGVVADDGSFAAYAGEDPACGGLAVGAVTGVFVEEAIEEGAVSWSLGAGCALGGLVIDEELRLEAVFTAERVGLILPAL